MSGSPRLCRSGGATVGRGVIAIRPGRGCVASAFGCRRPWDPFDAWSTKSLHGSPEAHGGGIDRWDLLLVPRFPGSLVPCVPLPSAPLPSGPGFVYFSNEVLNFF